MRLKEFWATFCPSYLSIYLSVRRIYQSSKIHGREQFSFTGAAAHIFIWLGQLGSSSLLLILLLSSSLPLAVAMMMKGFNLENSHNSGFLMMTKASFDENALSYIIYTCNNISYILYYYCCFWHNHAIANPPSGNKPTGYIHTLLPSLYNDAHKVSIYNTVAVGKQQTSHHNNQLILISARPPPRFR
jgi:hypothetical protein